MINLNDLGTGRYITRPFAVFLEELRLDYYVVYRTKQLFDKMLKIVTELRKKGFSTDFSYKKTLSQQMKDADRRRAKKCIIINEDRITLRDMDTGKQEELKWHCECHRSQTDRGKRASGDISDF